MAGTMDPVPTPTLVFDGDCAFGTGTGTVGVVRRVLPADITVVAWQFADLAALGVTAERPGRRCCGWAATEWCPVGPTRSPGCCAPPGRPGGCSVC